MVLKSNAPAVQPCRLNHWLATAACCLYRPLQLVVAYDPPLDVTLYIQARGRARAPGSTYAWMLPQSLTSQERKKMLEKHDSLIE
jgi:hypothetical protein